MRASVRTLRPVCRRPKEGKGFTATAPSMSSGRRGRGATGPRRASPDRSRAGSSRAPRPSSGRQRDCGASPGRLHRPAAGRFWRVDHDRLCPDQGKLVFPACVRPGCRIVGAPGRVRKRDRRPPGRVLGRIDVGAQDMAADAGRGLDLEDVLGRKRLRSLEPQENGRLRDAYQASQRSLRAKRVYGSGNCTSG